MPGSAPGTVTIRYDRHPRSASYNPEIHDLSLIAASDRDGWVLESLPPVERVEKPFAGWTAHFLRFAGIADIDNGEFMHLNFNIPQFCSGMVIRDWIISGNDGQGNLVAPLCPLVLQDERLGIGWRQVGGEDHVVVPIETIDAIGQNNIAQIGFSNGVTYLRDRNGIFSVSADGAQLQDPGPEVCLPRGDRLVSGHWYTLWMCPIQGIIANQTREWIIAKTGEFDPFQYVSSMEPN